MSLATRFSSRLLHPVYPRTLPGETCDLARVCRRRTGGGRIVAVRILSIQSHVAYGHVGNSAAVFPLQRLGHEVWPVLTVNFSNHTGYGAWRGPLIAPDDVAAVITGIEEREQFGRIDAVLSGYQGSPAISDVIVDAVARVKAANPAATYTCDPVMGNATSGCFVNPEIPPKYRDTVIPVADVVTPNQFELGFITGRDALSQASSLDDILAGADALRDMGPGTALITSVDRSDAPAESIEMLAVTGDGAWLVTTPRLPMKANGSGDITAALFTAHLHETGSAATALERTASSVFAVLKETLDSGERELRLVAAQDAIASPAGEFTAEQVR
jgi:pyridoxine kinase